MSATLDQPEITVPEVQLGLEDRWPNALKIPGVAAGWVLLLGLVFWVQSYQKVHYTDVWGHLAYGKLLWTTGTLPATEPIMPLAAGVPFVDTAWGSQVLGYLAQARWGGQALQFLHAASITAGLAMLAGFWQWRTRSFLLTLLGLGLYLGLNWQQFLVTRPQLAGTVCFAALLTLLMTRWSTAHWFAIPALLLAWTNLHGSFLIGLILLGCVSVGRAVDVLLRTGRISALWHDQPLRRIVVVTQLAAMATLLNPYGLSLYPAVVPFSDHPNLQDLAEWQPLYARSYQGVMVGGTILLLMFVYRQTPRRVTAIEVLTLVTFGAATLWSSRMLVWFAPLAAMAIVWHLRAWWLQRHPVVTLPVDADASPGFTSRRGLWTIVAVGLVWIFFAYTPFGLKLIYGDKAKFKAPLAINTPVGAAEFLVKNPPSGQIFNTYEWGDYLYWAGPPNLKIFVNSHADRVPNDIWRHYMAISNVSSAWEDYLDLYGVNTIVVDKADRAALIGRLRDHEKWNRVFEDNTAIIYTRKQPI